MDSLSKLNIGLFGILCLLFMFGGAKAYHGTEGIQTAPLPVRACFGDAQVYRELQIARNAGLSLEEQRLDNDFGYRILQYYSTLTGSPIPEDTQEKLDGMTVEIYSLSAEQVLNDTFMQAWVTTKFDECVSKIDMTPYEAPSESIQRMMPETGT